MMGDRDLPKKTRPQPYVGNSQQMLKEIRESLKHLPRQQQGQQPTGDVRTSGATTCITPVTTQLNRGQQNRVNANGKARALAEIRNSLEPYAACESGYSSCTESTAHLENINKQLNHQLMAIGYDQDAAAYALKVTPNHSVEDAIDMLNSIGVYPQRREHSPNRSPIMAPHQLKSPPPYNSFHRSSWKGSQGSTDSLNSNPRRSESPLTQDATLQGSPLRHPSPNTSQTSNQEMPNVEWKISKLVPQQYTGSIQTRPTPPFTQVRQCLMQDGVPKQNVHPSMQGGWRQSTTPKYSMSSQGQGLPFQRTTVVTAQQNSLPPPQFQVTAQVSLPPANASQNERGGAGMVSSSASNVSRTTASPMSFHVQVHTNFPSNSSSGSSTIAPVQPQRMQNSHGSREGSGDSQNRRRSPVPKGYYGSPQIISSNFQPPPAYAPQPPTRPLSGATSGIGSDTTSQLGCSSLSSVSSQSCLSSPTVPEGWRNSWNTETSSNHSSMSDDVPWFDSGPPSPSEFSSLQDMSGPIMSTSIRNMGGAIINYQQPQARGYRQEELSSNEPMDIDMDYPCTSQSQSQTSRQKIANLKGKVKNTTPEAFKFFMEQHVENVMKSREQREKRREQLEKEMRKVGLSEEAQSQMRQLLKQKETNYIRLKRTKMDISMFEKIRTIGIGAFGEVWLVRKTDTSMLYAMKILRKSEVFRRNQAAHVKAERDILAEADNEWVVKLYYSFQDQENLYFVMDYVPGGDLMSLLIKFGIFPEDYAKFYIAELVLAIDSVHRMGFVHRDIKPDNILIDKDGHIKLTDFGLCTGFRWTHDSKYYEKGQHMRQDSMEPDERAWEEMRATCHCGDISIDKPYSEMKPLERRHFRKHMRCQAHSLVGTPNYIAPEVLLRIGYRQSCDWWSVGVILYEMLVGQPPFLAPTPAETQLKIINWETELRIPHQARLSREAKDLILRLCTNADMRLGSNGASEIKAHPFFACVDWAYLAKRVQAPYTPVIRFPTDTANFDPVDPERLRTSDSGEDSPDRLVPDRSNHRPEHAFFEFTFRRFFNDGEPQPAPTWDPSEDDTGKGPVYV